LLISNLEDVVELDFYDFQAQIEQRKRELGIEETEADIEALRNKGGRRTEGKRALLRAAEQRALRSGKSPTRSYY
jgi:hypothetical protein